MASAQVTIRLDDQDQQELAAELAARRRANPYAKPERAALIVEMVRLGLATAKQRAAQLAAAMGPYATTPHDRAPAAPAGQLDLAPPPLTPAQLAAAVNRPGVAAADFAAFLARLPQPHAVFSHALDGTYRLEYAGPTLDGALECWAAARDRVERDGRPTELLRYQAGACVAAATFPEPAAPEPRAARAKSYAEGIAAMPDPAPAARSKPPRPDLNAVAQQLADTYDPAAPFTVLARRTGEPVWSIPCQAKNRKPAQAAYRATAEQLDAAGGEVRLYFKNKLLVAHQEPHT